MRISNEFQMNLFCCSINTDGAPPPPLSPTPLTPSTPVPFDTPKPQDTSPPPTREICFKIIAIWKNQTEYYYLWTGA